MVSTATKVGNFTFDNCLMNAAGVYCMTKEELAELEAAKKMPITFDADCPATTPEQAVKFKRVNPPRKRADAHMA